MHLSDSTVHIVFGLFHHMSISLLDLSYRVSDPVRNRHNIHTGGDQVADMAMS